MTTRASLHVLEVTSARELAVVLGELLPGADPLFTSWEDEDTGAVRFERYCLTRGDAEDARSRTGKLLDSAGLPRESWQARIRALPAQDWAEAWKAFFHVQRVSQRIVVKPSWEKHVPLPGDCVVEIDPGMSFGTGQHATTKACLMLLDGAVAGAGAKSFLDLGCGSGILSIAAAKLGFLRVVAVDNDPAAVECARVNAAANGVGGRVTCMEADVSRWRAARVFDVAAANILAPVLVQNAVRIARMVSRRAGGRLIIAGILTTQFAAVLEAYKAQGFAEERREVEGEWTSGLLVRAPHPSGCRRSRPTTSALK